MVWGQGICGTEVPQFGRGANPWHGSGAPPRFQLFVKVGARAPVSYGVDATLSDILIVNAAGVVDVFSL